VEGILSLLREQMGLVWYAVWRKLQAGTDKHYCMNTDRLTTRPRSDCSAGLAEFKIFFRQLCTKVLMRPTKDGLGVRIYNLRKGCSYESRRSEIRGPFCNWFVVHASKYFTDFANTCAWSFFHLLKVPCTVNQDIPMFLTAVWYITSENESRGLDQHTFFVSVPLG